MQDAVIFFECRPYISTPDAGREIGLSSSYVARLAKTGEIPARRLGHFWFVDQDAARLRAQMTK
jgi:hypothetical protein